MTQNPHPNPLPEYRERESAPPDFSGSIFYDIRLAIPEIPAGGRVLLDLGIVYYSAEVWINGVSVGRRAWSPYWFDLTHHVRSGQTINLRVRATNTLANQWLRPDVHARDMSERRNMYLEKTAPFMAESLHAGLAGPITLRIYT